MHLLQSHWALPCLVEPRSSYHHSAKKAGNSQEAGQLAAAPLSSFMLVDVRGLWYHGLLLLATERPRVVVMSRQVARQVVIVG